MVCYLTVSCDIFVKTNRNFCDITSELERLTCRSTPKTSFYSSDLNGRKISRKTEPLWNQTLTTFQKRRMIQILTLAKPLAIKSSEASSSFDVWRERRRLYESSLSLLLKCSKKSCSCVWHCDNVETNTCSRTEQWSWCTLLSKQWPKHS